MISLRNASWKSVLWTSFLSDVGAWRRPEINMIGALITFTTNQNKAANVGIQRLNVKLCFWYGAKQRI